MSTLGKSSKATKRTLATSDCVESEIMRRVFVIAGLAILSVASQAARYTFTPITESGNGQIRVKLDKGAAKAFRIPAWSPGDYELFNYGKNVVSIRFLKGGKAVNASQGTDVNLWTIPDGADEVVYEVKPSRGNFTVNLRVNADESFISPSAVFGWFDGHVNEKQTLQLPVPTGFSSECALPKQKGNPGTEVYVAANLDELLDSPFVISKNLKSINFTVDGVPHTVATYGKNDGVNLESYKKVGAAVAEQAQALFGELPYRRYVFFMDFGGGGGGLEHANGARIVAYAKDGTQAAGIIFHEFFHAFNVKRIRAKVLGPFDYTKPAITGTLWWLEGVTDYYADVLQVRAGLDSREDFLRSMYGTLRSLSRNPGSEKVSADEVSRRVWEVRGSNGFQGISYYTKGKGIGFLLDVAIRSYSKNKYSLDDVIRQLYEECKNSQPGYEDGRIRELCVKYGGPELGPIYDDCAMKAQHLPAEKVLKLGGFALGESGISENSGGGLGPTFPYDLRGKTVFNP